MKDSAGIVDLEFVSKNKRTIASKLYFHGNSRISARMPENDLAYHFLITTGGGFIEGEHYQANIKLSKEAHVVLTTQTPTYIYKCNQNKLTTQDVRIQLSENSSLGYYEDEVIPYKNARYRQKIIVDMKQSSQLILSDGITGGWSPDEKLFQYQDIGIKTVIRMDDELIYNDYLLCDPTKGSMNQLGYFEGFSNYNSVVIISNGIEDKIEELRNYLLRFDTKSRYGISKLEKNGLCIRVLGKSADDNWTILNHAISYIREQIFKYKPLDFRKRV